jgi:arylsulfatase A-like enzyme/Flp pilus assembly protein TadD
VIVISIDTLRADHLPAWGAQGVTTPNIDRLASDGVTYRNAYSQVPLTLPSHASLFTGLLPMDHGVRDNVGYRVTARDHTLPRVLQQTGYATGAAVSAYVLRGSTGLSALFEWYDDPITFSGTADLGSIQRSGAATVASAQKWIAPRAASPFFFFLHLFEPHSPYDPPEPYRSTSPTAYDGEIAYVDAILGTFFEDLRARGIYDRAIIVLLSDHGEGLDDHGEKEHGIFVYREAIHVPLIIKLPKNAAAGKAVDEPVGLIDVFPTILSLTGIQTQTGLPGIALLGPQAKPLGSRRIFSESLYARLHLGWSDLRSLVDSTHHYIDAPRAELYALREDPQEQRNVIADARREASALRTELAKLDKKLTAPSAASSEDLAKLAALGYISAPSAVPSGALPDPKDAVGQLRAYSAAGEALARGETQSAIDGFRSVLTQNPNFTDAALGLARAYETTRQYLAAADVYRDLLRRNPALTEQVAIGLATAFLNAKRLDEARSHAELALSSNPAAAHLLLGRIALAARAPAGAQQHAREAMRDVHYTPQATLLLAEALMRGNPPEAQEALRVLDALKQRRAAQGEAPVVSLEIARAGALMRLGRVDEAKGALREEIRLQPRDRDAYRRLAAIHLLQKDVEAAESVFAQMTAMDPSPASYTLAAETFALFGQRDAARSWQQRALQSSVSR